ncbi:MAG: dihydropteroate synthase [Planctomycetes bacterium]|nr:dihydropteroate synthase [Planctomycetota bacterium]
MPRFLFVTGKLAEPALRRLLTELGPRAGFEHSVAVLPITVAALATTSWIARHLTPPPGIDRILLPGLCSGDLDTFDAWGTVPVERGPKDMRDLPDFFGEPDLARAGYGAHDIAILAEINHAPTLPLSALTLHARRFHAEGADIIDLGCDPGSTWEEVGEAVKMLRDEGLRVSIDTFNPREAERGAAAGAEMVLSVNKTTRDQARHWGCEVVAVPDTPSNLEGLDQTVACLKCDGVPFRIDPVLEPIGFGFAASLGRYLEARRRFPEVEMLMGVGNLTELTDVDSAGVNVVLLGFCQEVGIRSVLTTEVINWTRSSVREIDLARRLVYHAVNHQVLPKHLEPELVALRDPKLRMHGDEYLTELAQNVTDKNFRLFAERGVLHAINSEMHWKGIDPFELFAAMARRSEISPAHAFYLGYEMAKMATALALGKNYVQDQALSWGFLTADEKSHGPSQT